MNGRRAIRRDRRCNEVVQPSFKEQLSFFASSKSRKTARSALRVCAMQRRRRAPSTFYAFRCGSDSYFPAMKNDLTSSQVDWI